MAPRLKTCASSNKTRSRSSSRSSFSSTKAISKLLADLGTSPQPSKPTSPSKPQSRSRSRSATPTPASYAHEIAPPVREASKPIVLPRLPYSQYIHQILLCDTKDPVHVNNVLTWWMISEELAADKHGVIYIEDYNGSWTLREPWLSATVLVFLPDFFTDGTGLFGWGVPTDEGEIGLVKDIEWQVPGMHIDECYLQLLEAGKMEERKSISVGTEDHWRIHAMAEKDVMRVYTMRWVLGAPVKPVGFTKMEGMSGDWN